jgi:hypothetical protein
MAQYELNTTQIALLEALKASLFGIEPNYPEDTDWAEVVNEAKVQTVMGVISPVVPVTDEITNIGITNYSMLLYELLKVVKIPPLLIRFKENTKLIHYQQLLLL